MIPHARVLTTSTICRLKEINLNDYVKLKKQIQHMILFNLMIYLFAAGPGCKELPVQKTQVNTISTTEDTTPVCHPDHIIFLWLENRGFNTIINNGSAPFINSLVKRGTLFTNSYAITHPSYPNYIDFFAGQDNGVKSDACIAGTPLATANLCSVLAEKGKSFAWYSEDLPATGSRVCMENYYVQKHNPTTVFLNVPDSVNKTFGDFPKDYSRLENVVCISPDLVNDMHSGTIRQADNWLKKHLSSLVDWCETHNSIFVIYFDESETENDNRIPVIAVGQPVKTGYRSNTRYDHFSWTRTICDMFSAEDEWTPNLHTAKTISGCWK
jgi:phosphatidylinositol-3-phosphatase